MLVSLWLDKAYFLALFHLNWSLFWLHFRIYQTEMVFQIVSYQLVGKRCVKSWTSLKNTSFNTFWVRIGLNISNELTWLLFQHANENVSTVWSSELDTLLMRYGVKFTSSRIKSVSNSLDQTIEMLITVVPTVTDHKITNAMVCQICNKKLVVIYFFNFPNIYLVGPYFF